MCYLSLARSIKVFPIQVLARARSGWSGCWNGIVWKRLTPAAPSYKPKHPRHVKTVKTQPYHWRSDWQTLFYQSVFSLNPQCQALSVVRGALFCRKVPQPRMRTVFVHTVFILSLIQAQQQQQRGASRRDGRRQVCCNTGERQHGKHLSYLNRWWALLLTFVSFCLRAVWHMLMKSNSV